MVCVSIRAVTNDENNVLYFLHGSHNKLHAEEPSDKLLLPFSTAAALSHVPYTFTKKGNTAQLKRTGP